MSANAWPEVKRRADRSRTLVGENDLYPKKVFRMKFRIQKWCLLLSLGTLLGAGAAIAHVFQPELQAWAQGPSTAVLQPEKKKVTFTILHTNDLHASIIGMGPSSDYTPFTLNDDATRGGWARLAALIATRKEARKDQGPVLVLDAGDYSMGTPFSAATRETGCELRRSLP
jgi:2',3'-cyclic-nucleotide 2'-phosphodiesterase (5'-nucleotidase family)